MKAPQYFTLLALAAVALILTVVVIVYSQGNQKLQEKFQAGQEDINRGSMSQQVGQNLLKDIALGSQKSAVLKDVLTRNGYTVTASPGASPSPSASPASSSIYR